YMVFILFTIINILLYKYAPADTENHPLFSADLRNKLKKDSVITGIILMIFTLLIPNNAIKTLVSLAAISAVTLILPITYNLLKRSYKNYENYEKDFI
ncbi:accessory gene regulator B family protein, partial [Clostridium butyricum]